MDVGSLPSNVLRMAGNIPVPLSSVCDIKPPTQHRHLRQAHASNVRLQSNHLRPHRLRRFKPLPPQQTLSFHSVLYNITTNTFRPLTLFSDPWCSSGAVTPDDTLIQTGSFNDGYNRLHTFHPLPVHNLCDWVELQEQNLTTVLPTSMICLHLLHTNQWLL
ncbi:hypothetical protein RIF29_08695 [Crotalaria pallida]|uniref:Glyoxal oxidase N-terminal domain-containing protein n=1 Tax=Crotalaria pallida TaxID=3830 RepID=A0AAN9IJ42_CROPI